MPAPSLCACSAPGATTVSSCPLACAAFPCLSRYERTPPPRSEKNSQRSKMRSEEGRVIEAVEGESESATARRPGQWPERLGILNDYVRIPYANGSSFASQFLYREFKKRGHRVTVIGPDD